MKECRECVAIHYTEEIIKEVIAELSQILEELFLEEQGEESLCSQIQRGVYLTSLGRELLSLN